MNRLLKTLLIAALVLLGGALIGLAVLYATFCTGHPHGMC